MSIYGNVILPQKTGFIYGENQPNVPSLWFNTSGAEIASDPDVAHGLLLYMDEEGNQNPLYPMTTIAAVYGLTEKMKALDDSDKKASDNLSSIIKPESVQLPVDGWTEKTITVNVDGVTEKNTVIVGCAAESYEAYCESSVRCTGQGNGTLTFSCGFVPDADVTVNVVILNEVCE